ncbi:gamma-glutamyltransferase family protein, partial [Oleidesulfovibrio sp.]|uniref:gamma-glutamyltransferase family protein n=1 Tax=Oleidesulfovibrio sp. TaxID=2909707 RepID=UPI003A89DEC8
LAVVEPCSTGLGGDAFALYYNAADGRVSALNGSGRSGAGHSMDAVYSAGFKEIPPRHGLAVTVPGACAAWCRLHEKFGRLDLAKILAPAIHLARKGFAVGPVTARLWSTEAALLQKSAGGSVFLTQGRTPATGERMTNAPLADLLESIGRMGMRALYEGDAASALVKTLKAEGGVLTESDLAAADAQWQQPCRTEYGGVQVHECPPNGQGIVALMALNTLQALPLESYGAPESASRLHAMIEALRLAFADGRKYICEPGKLPIPTDALLDKLYGVRRAAMLRPDTVIADIREGSPVASSDTVQFCVADRDGNACSMVNSVYMTFGSGIVVPELGIVLQNRGHNFVLEAEHPNCLAPQKRPYHTIIPCLTTNQDGTLHGVMGVMGGFMQPQGHVQILSAMLDDDCNPQQALDRLRFCIMPFADGSQVLFEEGVPESVLQELRQKGHSLEIVKGYARDIVGRGQIILKNSAGFWEAGSDGRADGLALGY